MILRRGIGEYPGYYCYDANRPAWLPYWIDDLTESACKWNPQTIAGNITACVGGSPTCQNPSVAQQNPALSGPGVAPAGSPSNTPTCPTFQTFDPASSACVFDITSPSFLFLMAGSLGAVLLLLAVGGHR